jgi:hypothetical protein
LCSVTTEASAFCENGAAYPETIGLSVAVISTIAASPASATETASASAEASETACVRTLAAPLTVSVPIRVRTGSVVVAWTTEPTALPRSAAATAMPFASVSSSTVVVPVKEVPEVRSPKRLSTEPAPAVEQPLRNGTSIPRIASCGAQPPATA